MRDRQSLRTFVERFRRGDFDSPDVQTQIEAGWYDWFCKDSSLRNKTKRLGSIICQIDGVRVDLDKTYVFFKNNCSSILYDDFRICDIETGNVLINVNVGNPYDKTYAVYGRFPEGDFWGDCYIEFNTVKELVKWLNSTDGTTNAYVARMKAKKLLSEAYMNGYGIIYADECIDKNEYALTLRCQDFEKAKETIEKMKEIDGFCACENADDRYGGKKVTLRWN